MRFLVIDTETGGLDPQRHSILTIGAVVVDLPSGRIVDQIEIKVQEDIITVDPEAMAINRINLEEHRKVAVTTAIAARQLYEFADRHFKGVGPIRIAGHNVEFDVQMLRRLWRLAGQGAPRWPFDFRTIDTTTLGYADKLRNPCRPWDSPSLDKMLKFYDITMLEQDRHTALGDALATTELLVALVRNERNGDCE